MSRNYLTTSKVGRFTLLRGASWRCSKSGSNGASTLSSGYGRTMYAYLAATASGYLYNFAFSTTDSVHKECAIMHCRPYAF